MTIFLRFQFEKFKSCFFHKSPGINVLVGLVFLGSIFFSKETFALGPCLGNATVTVNPITASTTICSGTSITLLLDATSGGTSVAGPWSANYQWDSSSDGGLHFYPVFAGGSGVISASSPTALYTTASLSSTIIYEVQLTGIIGNCGAGSILITNSITVTVKPSPAGITGPGNVCVGATDCLTDATTGGTWSSSNILAATVGASGCVFGIGTGTTNIIYNEGGCSTFTTVTVNATAPISGPSSVCVGNTITLTDATTGVTWSSGTGSVATIGFTSGIVNGLSSGSTTIIGTSPLGCIAVTTIFVNPNPVSISGNLSVCAGSMNCLSDASTGGTWGSSNTAVATVGTSGCVTGSSVTLGTSTITYTLPTGCFITSIVTVNPLPLAISGTASVCQGQTTALTDVGGGGWATQNAAIATVTGGGVVTGVGAGITNITYTLPTGCYMVIAVTVNPLAPITGSLNVCPGGSTTTTLGDPATGGTWSASNTNATIGSTGIVSGNTIGVDTIIYTLPFGCIATAAVTVDPLPAAITGSIPVCVGSSITLADGTTGGTWTSAIGTVAIVGSSTGVVTGITGNTVNITYTLPTGCYSTVVVTVNPVSSITGSSYVCVGGTIALTDATAGGIWSSSAAGTATVDGSGNVTGISAGTTIISYMLGSGCTVTTIVTVDPLPAPITGNLFVCAWGSTTLLADASTGGLWTSTLVVINPSTGLVEGFASGVGTVTYILPTGCQVAANVTVNPLPAPITGNTSVCVGSSTQLSDITTGGAWSSSNGNATVGTGTGLVMGAIAGTSSIIYTLPTGCTADTTVVVDPVPSAVTGVGTVCFGSTTALTDITTGGTWTSSNTAIGSVNATGVVTGTGALGGTVIISYELATGCLTTTVVTVNPMPSAITGNNYVCKGDTSVLADATTGGIWSSSNTAIDTIDAGGAVYGVSGGIGAISYTLRTGCLVTTTFTVNPINAISGNAVVCYGATTTLTDTTMGGTWSSSATGIASIGMSSGIVTGTGAGGGTATITYMLATGCTAYSVVTVNPLPSGITGTGSVCAGLTTTLNDATTGGNWTSSNSAIAQVGATGIVTGEAAGTATITYTISTGCYVTTTVTVYPLTTITGSGSVCVGYTTSLTDGATGGTWSSSTVSAGTVDGSGNVYGLSAGTTTISYALPTGCTATMVVTVNPLAPITSGNSGVCVGLSITLGDAALGGTWSASNGNATVNITSGTVTGVTNGVDIITYTLPGSCIATTTVTVNSISNISGPTNVCEGSSITLSDASAGGTWSSEDTAIATVDTTTGVVNGVRSGTTIISYSYGSSCYVIYAVIVNPMTPIYGNLNLCPGFSTTLTDSTAGTWSSSDTTVASIGAGTGVVTAVNSGNATISYTSSTGCIATAVVTVGIVFPITGTTSLCSGATTGLTDITTGGTWSTGNAAIAMVGTGGVVTASSINSGTVNITYTLPTGCVAVAMVTVNPFPSPITGPTTMCAFIGSVQLSDATSGGIWSSTVADINLTGLLTAEAAGVATITYELPTGCSTYYTVTVNALPADITGSLQVCQGLTTILSDAATGGTWSSGVVTVATVNPATGVVGGVGTGSTFITYTLPSGCMTDTLFTVNPLPGPINGPTSLCQGLTITLTDGTTGGLWSSGSTGVARIGSSTGIVSGIAAGTAIITYKLGTGCINTVIITVNPLPGSITGGNTVCVGQTITLIDGTTGGTWNSSSTLVETIGVSTGLVTGISAGVVTDTYRLSTGCIATTMVTVNALSPVTGNPSLCIGLTTNLTDGTFGGTWSSSNPLIGTVSATGVVTGTGVGVDTIIYILPSGCTATLSITVNALPSAISGILTTCVGQTTTLSDGTTGGVWTSNNIPVATVTSSAGVVTGVMAGTATIVYSLGSGCEVTAVVTVNPLSHISGVTNLCQGQVTTVSDAVAGGTWGSSSSSTASVDASGNVTAGNTGTAVISYVLPSGCITTIIVTVNPLAPINGTADLCEGVTTIFTDAINGGTWTSSNPGVASVVVPTGAVTGHAPGGVAIISYTLPTGCVATFTVTVNSLAAITGPSAVCSGDSIVLMDATAGGIWSSSDDSTAWVTTTGTVNGDHSGTAIISYSYGPGCVVVKAISVDPSTPIFGNLNICLGLTTTLSDTTLGGTWSSGSPLIASAVTISDGVFFGVNVGTATVTYTLGTGCVQTAVVTVSATAAVTGTDSVCAGLTTTLTDATAGATWSSSNTSIATVSSTGIVTGITAGIDSIIATSPVGCIAVALVTVDPLPSAILGNPEVCIGLTTTLSDTTDAGIGTWSSSNTSIATIDPVSGLVTGVDTGTVLITYTLPTGCIITVSFTVNPPPPAISGTLFVCVNSTTLLTDAVPGGTWSSSNTLVATIGHFTGNAYGVSGYATDTITYTIGTGCSITAILTVNPLPSIITGNANICIGNTNALTDSTIGGTWSSSDTSVATVDMGGNVTGDTLGTSVITYTMPSGCTATLVVTVDPLPSAIFGVDSICIGSNTSLTDAVTGGTWISSDTTIASVGSTSGVVTGVRQGIVTITYTLASGCTATVIVTIDPLPQPITGNFTVCLGFTSALSDLAFGGVWSSNDTFIASVDSTTGLVTGNALGITTITYTLPTGCIQAATVTVDPLPLAITGSVPLCVGDSTMLLDATTGGTWASSLVDTAMVNINTGEVTGEHSGTATITYTIGTGCFSTTVVTVNPIPLGILGPNTVCVNDSIHLTDGNPGGTWISQASSIASVDSAGWVTGQMGATAGLTLLITYTLPTGCSTTDLITVFSLPPAIVGPSQVCVGSQITLSDSSVGGTWASSLIDTASINPEFGVVTGLHSGTTTISYTSTFGSGSCIITTVITVNPTPSAILGTTAICNGFTTLLSDLSPGGSWSSSDVGISTVTPSGVIITSTLVTGISPGADSIFYTYPITGCRAIEPFIVHPIPVITVSSFPDAQVCIGASVQLTASGAGGGGGYNWSPSFGLSATVGDPVTASPSVTTTYTVIGTTQYGCSHDTTVVVHVDSTLLHIQITGKDSICIGECDTLIASGFTGSLFQWTPVADLTTIIGDTSIDCGTMTHTYFAIAIDSFGCKDSASFKVTVNPLPNITVAPNPAIVCRGSSTQLTASGANTYTWFPNAFLSCDSCANPIASDTQNLVYNVIGTSIYGCRDSIYVPVSVLDTNKNTISDDTIVCQGHCAQLIATSTSVDGSHPDYFLWTPSNGLSDPNVFNPVACPDTTTAYTVVIKENVCFSDTEHVIVYVEPYPNISITSSVVGQVPAGSMVQLSATITNEVLVPDYEWTPGYGLSCQKCFDPVATPTMTSTTYTFTATSNYGCTSTDTVSVHIFCDNAQVFIPNTFTPNGDGQNDLFFVSAKGVSLITRLSIYNRWGQLVFQSVNTQPNDPGAGWDGTFKGVVLPPDVFVYVAEVQCELGGTPFSFKGDVSIVK